MAPSEDDCSVAELSRRLETAPPGERRALATELVKRHQEQEAIWEPSDLTDDVLERVLPFLDDPDPGVRSAVAIVVRFVAQSRNVDWVEVAVDRPEHSPRALVDRLLDHLDDEDWRVRQSVLKPAYLEEWVSSSLEAASSDPIRPPEWMAGAVLDRFRDPQPVVRKRAAKLLENHRIETVLAHPDSERAVDHLVSGLEDPNDAIGDAENAGCPRLVALSTLVDLVGHRTDLVVDRLDAVLDAFEADGVWDSYEVVDLLDALVETEALDYEDVETPVRGALEADRFPKTGRERLDFLVDLAIECPAVLDPLTPMLRDELGVESPHGPPTARADRVARLAHESDRPVDPVFETVADLAADTPFDQRDTDPLALLAADHPEYVATQLRRAFERAVGDGLPNNTRFDGDTAVAVADVDPAPVERVLPVLVDGLEQRIVQRILDSLAADHPDVVATAVPEMDVHPQHRYYLGRVLTRAVEAGAEPSDASVDALVETVDSVHGTPEKSRYWAAKALVALADRDDDAVPDRTAPLVAADRDGHFDTPVDPLDIPTVRAVWGPDPNEE